VQPEQVRGVRIRSAGGPRQELRVARRDTPAVPVDLLRATQQHVLDVDVGAPQHESRGAPPDDGRQVLGHDLGRPVAVRQHRGPLAMGHQRRAVVPERHRLGDPVRRRTEEQEPVVVGVVVDHLQLRRHRGPGQATASAPSRQSSSDSGMLTPSRPTSSHSSGACRTSPTASRHSTVIRRSSPRNRVAPSSPTTSRASFGTPRRRLGGKTRPGTASADHSGTCWRPGSGTSDSPGSSRTAASRSAAATSRTDSTLQPAASRRSSSVASAGTPVTAACAAAEASSTSDRGSSR
jgi:hypothetical protein